MKYTGPIFRPPTEAGSLLLQVTVGCAHNKCTYCSMYREVSFGVEQIEQIERDLLEARKFNKNIKRVFLVNGDAFVLSAKRLKEIALKINEILPEVETIAMYASIRNVMDKSDEELKELRKLKINELNIGIESGHPKIVEAIRKGYSNEDAVVQLERLNKAGIDFSTNIILGLGGKGMEREDALATAKLINRVKPKEIFIAPLGVNINAEIGLDAKEGRFTPSNLRENIEQEMVFIEKLELDNLIVHGYFHYQTIYGILPRDKEKMIGKLKMGINSFPNEQLNKSLWAGDYSGNMWYE